MKKNNHLWTEYESAKLEPETKITGDNLFEDLFVPESASLDRRQFLKLSSFTIGFSALLNACKQPVREAIPFLIQPDNVFPGEASWYATSFWDGYHFASVLAKTMDGRPIKIEGNDACPHSAGGTTAKTQASLLSLYHPGRVRNPAIDGIETDWDEFIPKVKSGLDDLKKQNLPLLILSSTIISLESKKILEKFLQKYPNAEIIYYDEISSSAIVDAHSESFNFPSLPFWHFDRATTILSLNCDFLGSWISPEIFNYQYSRAKAELSDFFHIQAEAAMSLTGSNADLRVPLSLREEKAFLIALRNVLNRTFNSGVLLPEENSVECRVDEIGRRLLNSATSIIVSGTNDYEIQVLVCSINHILGNYGKTIEFRPNYLRSGKEKFLSDRLSRLKQEKCGGILFLNSDPLNDLDPELGGILPYLDFSMSISCHHTTTSDLSTFVCPDNHPYESWRVYQPYEGEFYFSQALIQPLFQGYQFEDLFLVWSDEKVLFKDFLKQEWEQRLGVPDTAVVKSEIPWLKCLKQGLWTETKEENDTKPEWNKGVLKNLSAFEQGEGMELLINESVNYGTGMTIGNPWLLELPDPVNLVSWGSFASVSPSFALKNDLKTGDEILINSELSLPVIIQPGQAENSISIPWGYGKTFRGFSQSATGKCLSGYIKTSHGYRIYHVSVVNVVKSGTSLPVSRIQIHDSDENRDPVLTVNQSESDQKPDEAHNRPGLYQAYEYPGHKWGMVIDLDKCTGCNACVIACQAENNIPVVGSSEIRRHHEMYWLRIDRYYSGSAENPKVLRQPVMCQHCDSAPCENVCPVLATTHSTEGINQMIYNRCIGTRYCSNNCPYKARVFNWFDYNMADAIKGNTHDYAGMTADLPRMIINPDVVQRAKGVMEKCSFCIQRIEEAKITAKKENRALKDGEIKPACQQACPSKAIVFGDLNDPDSEVSRLTKDSRVYKLLDDLNTGPAVSYLKKIIRC